MSTIRGTESLMSLHCLCRSSRARSGQQRLDQACITVSLDDAAGPMQVHTFFFYWGAVKFVAPKFPRCYIWVLLVFRGNSFLFNGDTVWHLHFRGILCGSLFSGALCGIHGHFVFHNFSGGSIYSIYMPLISYRSIQNFFGENISLHSIPQGACMTVHKGYVVCEHCCTGLQVLIYSKASLETNPLPMTLSNDLVQLQNVKCWSVYEKIAPKSKCYFNQVGNVLMQSISNAQI